MTGLQPAIIAEGLSKRYPGTNKHALKDLNLRIMSGEVYGFLGPNGAGKSTTIRTLMNFIQPTSGKAQICGLDIVKESVRVKSRVGYLAGEVELYPKMTGRQFLQFMAELQPPKNIGFQKELVKLFDASLNKKIRDLSKGNRQKIGLIQAFMHEPEVLILDEPTSGLDPLMQEAFFDLVRNMRDRGCTLFISSHNLSEVQKMCDRVGFIREGKLIAEQNIGEFNKNAPQIYDIAFAEPAPLEKLKKIPHAKVTSNTPYHVTVQVKGDLSALLTTLSLCKVHSLDRRESALEEEFLSFYKGKSS